MMDELTDGRTHGRTFERDGIYVFSYFGYLCGYLPMCGLDTQESILATKVSNLQNKSHLYSKMTTCVSNCPNFIATGLPISLYGRTDGQTWATLNALPHSSNGGGIKIYAR